MSNAVAVTPIFDPGLRPPVGVGVLGLTCYARNHHRCSGEVITEPGSKFNGAVVECICPCGHRGS